MSIEEEFNEFNQMNVDYQNLNENNLRNLKRDVTHLLPVEDPNKGRFYRF